MAGATLGSMKEFDPEKGSWTEYSERLKHYFAANNIEDAALKRSVLITVMGEAAYARLRRNVAPAKVDDKTFDELVKVMSDHCNPSPSVIMQRYKFNTRGRQPNESVMTYVAELRALAEHCKFPTDFLNELLRDRLVCGINDQQIQRRLLAKRDLKLQDAIDEAMSCENATKDYKALQLAPEDTAQPLLKVKMAKGQTSPPVRCFRCNKTGHNAASCRFKSVRCHQCGKTGHLKAACHHRSSQRPAKGGVKSLQAEDDSLLSPPAVESEEYQLFAVEAEDVGCTPPLTVQMQLDGVPLRMEVDTGAAISIISEDTFKRLWKNRELQKSSVTLRTYSGEPLKVLGAFTVLAEHGSQKKELILTVVQGSGPSLVGRNWLDKFPLDWGRIHHVNNALQEVLSRHSSVFSAELGTLKDFKVSLAVDETVKPRYFKARPVPYAMRALVDEELDRLESLGVIEPVTHSEWAAPIVPILKPDKKSVRICGDFKMTVNQAVKVDRYPIPLIQDLFAGLNGGKFFTKLDLSHAYLQLLVDDKAKELLVINTHKGLFRYNRLPFGIASAPGIFQRTMENLLRGIPRVAVYLDDILISGETEEAHLKTLDQVLERLEKAGLKLKEGKCSFLSSSVVYLGHRIDEHGLSPTQAKVEAVLAAPEPKNVTALKAYLGLLNYYGRFMPNLSSTLAPLYKLLNKNAHWRWSHVEKRAFQASKKLLTEAPVLVHYDPSKELILSCDASAYGLGAVLAHKFSDGSEKPIAFASRTLSPAEKGYSQLEKEGLACVFGVKKFHEYLFGRMFSLYTDHKPLLGLLDENKSIPVQASARIQRWALTLETYQYQLKFKTSKQNANADALSRLPLTTVHPPTPQPTELVLMMEALDEDMPVSSHQIKTWTRRDPTLSRVLQFVQKGWPTTVKDDQLKMFEKKKLELSCQDHCLLWGSRVVVPPQGQQAVLRQLHSSHPGVVRMKQLARAYVWWPNMDKDIERHVRHCATCQVNQSSPPVAPVIPIRWPSRPWSRIHVDLAGPFLNHTFLVVVDAYTKWLEVHILPSATSSATITCLRKIFATYGVPEILVSDNGSNFTSKEFETFLKQNGVIHKTSAPYHPASNGLAERAVRTFKHGIKKITKGALQDRLSRFLFAYRNIPQTTTGHSPAELMFNRHLRSPMDLLKPDLNRRMEEKQDEPADPKREFKPHDLVFVKNFPPGSKPKWLPGEIQSTDGPRSFTISLSDGRIVRRHLDHIRRRYPESKVDVDLTPAVEPSPKEIVKPVESDASATLKEKPTEQTSVTDASATLKEKPTEQSTVPEPTDSADDPPTPPPRRNPPRNRKPPSRYGDYVRSN